MLGFGVGSAELAKDAGTHHTVLPFNLPLLKFQLVKFQGPVWGTESLAETVTKGFLRTWQEAS